jgi:anti-sigma-K factor RskA
MNENKEEVMLDLLCKKAVYGLEPHEEKQLAELEAQMGGADHGQSFELTAASIATAGLDMREEMPAHLESRILADARSHFAGKSQSRTTRVRSFEPERSGSSIFNWLGWAVAAAACLALALNIYYTRTPNETVRTGPAPTPEQRLTPAEERQRLIESAPDLKRAAWGPGKMTEVKPSGDVVWSDTRQAGYMRLSGLPKNDPTKETYQLWIISENQDPKTPVDGGTFDITSEGEVIIPIDAKVKALNPQAFAITIEKPGGVPVSRQERVPALAKPES